MQESMEYIDYICTQLERGQAAVLVGAGLSLNADKKSSEAKSYPVWSTLKGAFARKISQSNYDDLIMSHDVMELAEMLEATRGRSELDRTILEAIPDEQYIPSEVHNKLLRLPWTDIFTTNYDTLLERASENVFQKRFKQVHNMADLTGRYPSVPRIIKLHGSMPSGRPFIITSEDYRSYPHKFALFVNTVQQSMIENTFCLVGFSGKDPNFEKWIGWIRDNLKENTPYIYLLTHEKLKDSYKKFLYNRKVIAVEISDLNESGDVRDKYDKLFEYMLDKVPDDKPSWPKSDHYSDIVNAKYNKIEDLLPVLMETRANYPGWLVVPRNMRWMLKNMKESISGAFCRVFTSLKDQPNSLELEFLFEYDWMREKSLLPPFPSELKIYDAVVSRAFDSILIKERKAMLGSIILSIMRVCRENGDFDAWRDYHKKIGDNLSDSFDYTLKHRWAYESCLYSLFNYNFVELISKLKKWEVQPQDHNVVLFKAGLLCEVNYISEAKAMVDASLDSIRRQLQYDDRNQTLLSLESVTMTLAGLLSSVTGLRRKANKADGGDSYTEFDFKKNSNDSLSDTTQSEKSDDESINDENAYDYKYDRIRRNTHIVENCDWSKENNDFTNNLLHKYTGSAVKTIVKSFDFGHSSTLTHHGNDGEAMEAMSYLRFREDTGFPFRIQLYVNTNDDSKAVIGAIQRIIPYYYINWATITAVRSDNEKAIDFILTRPLLSNLSLDEVSEFAKYYSDALHESSKESDINAYYGIVAYSNHILPKLLSLLCCKCSTGVLDEMLEVALQICISKNRRHHDQERTLFIRRLMESYSDEEKLDRVPLLLKFPATLEEYTYIDPMRFLPLNQLSKRKTKRESAEIEGSEQLIDNGSSEDKQMSIGRLIILSNNGLLTTKQHDKLLQLLSESNYKLPKWLFSTALLCLDGLQECEDARKYIKDVVMNKLGNEITSAGINIGNPTYSEFVNAVSNRIFSLNDAEPILTKCHDLLKKFLRMRKNKDTFIDFDAPAEPPIRNICVALFHLIVQYSSNDLPDESIKLLDSIMSLLSEENYYCSFLDLAWRTMIGNEVNASFLIADLLSSDTDRSVLDTMNLSFVYRDVFSINSEVLDSCMDILCNRILWSRDERINSVIHVVNNAINTVGYELSGQVMQTLLDGLNKLYIDTTITVSDSVDSANSKGSTRIEGLRLAKTLKHWHEARELPIPSSVALWMNILSDDNEFLEIRKSISLGAN